MTQEAGKAEDLIVRNLIEALNRLRDDLDRVELWTAALGSFRRSVPEYRPGSDYLLRSASHAPIVNRIAAPRPFGHQFLRLCAGKPERVTRFNQDGVSALKNRPSEAALGGPESGPSTASPEP